MENQFKVGEICVVVSDSSNIFQPGDLVKVIRIDSPEWQYVPYLCEGENMTRAHMRPRELRKEEFTDIVKQILKDGKV